MEIDVFKHNSYTDLLKELFDENKKKNKAFSYRYFSKKSGLKSPSLLKMIMDGERSLTLNMVPYVSKGFKLNDREERFLRTLVQYQNSEDADEVREMLSELNKMKVKFSPTVVDESVWNVFSGWYYWAILQVVELKNFKDDPELIARRLKGGLNKIQVEKAINDLIAVGLLKRKDGKLCRTFKSISTGNKVGSSAVKMSHTDFMKLAILSLNRDDHTRREMHGVTMSISEKKFGELKASVQKFKDEILELVQDSKDADRVYRLNLQLFPLDN